GDFRDGSARLGQAPHHVERVSGAAQALAEESLEPNAVLDQKQSYHGADASRDLPQERSRRFRLRKLTTPRQYKVYSTTIGGSRLAGGPGGTVGGWGVGGRFPHVRVTGEAVTRRPRRHPWASSRNLGLLSHSGTLRALVRWLHARRVV